MTSASPPWPWLAGGVLIGGLLAFRLSSPPAPVAQVSSAPTAPAALPATWQLTPGLPAAEVSARIASWLALDPATSPYAERALGLRALLAVADAGQLAALADRLARRGGEDDTRWFQSVFDRWVERAPADATRWTATLGTANTLPADAFARAREQAALAWAAQSFDPAYAWTLAQPDAGRPDGLAARLLGWLAETDSPRALALAEARGPEAAAAMLRPIFDAWAKRDPEAALQALAPRLLATNINIYDIFEPLKAWLQKSPDALLAWMATHPKLARWRGEDFSMALASYKDRLASITAVMRVGDPELKYEMLRGILVNGWQVEQEQAAGLVEKLEDPELRARLVRDANQMTYSGATERNLPFALLLPPGSERDARLIDLTSRWAERDPLAALDWLKKHDEPAVAAAIQAATLGAIAQDEPQTALATWSALPAGPARDHAVDAIAKGWARQDPAQAAAWLVTQNATRDTNRETNWETVDAIMKTWTPKDADAALAWAETRFSTARDNTPLYVWAQNISSQLPIAQAADQIGRISDLSTRRQTLFNHVHRWLQTDPAPAEAWLNKQCHVAPEVARSWIDEARQAVAR